MERIPSRWSRPVRVALALVTLLVVTACGNPADLSFRNDHRLRFTAPEHRALTGRPVAIRWEMTGFRVVAPGSESPSRDAGYFAIFVDRAPVKPGQALRDIAAGDRECQRDPTCPDEKYLADHGIYATTQTSYTLTSVPDLPTKERVQLHTVTIVVLDTESRRTGESAWHVEFRLPKRDLR